MMKLAVFLALVAVGYSEFVFPNFISDSITSCMIEHGVITQETLASRTRPLNEEDECYVKCFLQSFQAIDKDGNFTPREYFLFFSTPDHPVSETALEYNINSVKDCGFADIENICERAKKISRCIHSRKTPQN